MKQEGFIYIWRDRKRKLFYIGSHKGTIDDGYICSSMLMKQAYNKRPHDFKRRILEYVKFEKHTELIERENYWLSKIKPQELHKVRYYNIKNVATGGDIISSLPDNKKQLHKERSLAARRKGWDKWMKERSFEELSQQGKHARSFVKNPNGGSMPGEKNPFYGKKHTDETRKKISSKRKGIATRFQKIKIEFPDGRIEFFNGCGEITRKYCQEIGIKFGAFINTNKPVWSKRFQSQKSPLIGSILTTVDK